MESIPHVVAQSTVRREELAQRIWIDLSVAELRDGLTCRELRALRARAWTAWVRLAAERERRERLARYYQRGAA